MFTFATTDSPRTQLPTRLSLVVQDYPNGDSLHDLGEVSRGVFGRQYTELSSRRWRDTDHLAAELPARDGIDFDHYGRSGVYPRQLALLVIGIDPQAARWNEGKELRTGRGVSPDLCTAVSNPAIDWRAQLSVAEIKPGELAFGIGLLQAGLGLLDLGINHHYLPFCRR